MVTGGDAQSVPMNTILLTRASFPHAVECSFSNSSYTPWTITRLVSLVTDTTPCLEGRVKMQCDTFAYLILRGLV